MTTEDHTGGPVSCEQLGAFVDGELDAGQAEAFRRHLVQCARCQSEMHGLLQLSGLAEEAGRTDARSAAATALPLPPHAWRWRLSRLTAAGGVALAAALVAVVVVKQRSRAADDVPTLLASLDARSVSGWPSGLRAQDYHRYEISRGRDVRQPDAFAQTELKLLASSRWRDLATLALLRRDFGRAEDYLARLPRSPEVLSDRGLILLEQSRCDEALEYLDDALELEANYPPALFNRARCLRDLNLPLASAREFGRVRAAGTGGWGTEAAEYESDLARQTAALNAGEDEWRVARRRLLEEFVPFPEALVRRNPSRARSAGYAALATAPDRASLTGFGPAVGRIDAAIGQPVLERRRQATLRQRLGPERKELAAQLRRWLLRLETPTPEQLDAFLAAARRGGERDILLVTLENFRKWEPTPERIRLVSEWNDPWSTIQLAVAQGYVARGSGRLSEAERILRGARRSCLEPSMAIPCWYVSQQLAEVYRNAGRIQDAMRESNGSATGARQAALYEYERNSLIESTDLRVAAGHVASAEATYEEMRLREPDHCAVAIWGLEQLADGYLRRGELAKARSALGRRPQCEHVREPWSVEVESNLAILERDPRSISRAVDLAQQLAQTSLLEKDRTLYRFIAASGRLELSEGGATNEIWELTATSSSPTDRDLESARAAGLAELALVSIRESQPARAFDALARLSGTTASERCALGWVDHLGRRGWAARLPNGQTQAGMVSRLDGPLRLPDEVTAALGPCPSIDVYATGNLQGKGGLLPDSLPWSFRTAARRGQASSQGPKVIVRDARAPAELRLPPLGFRERRDLVGWELLEGPAATPSRVERALKTASVIDFEVHGWVDSEIPDGAVLVLSEDSDRRYTLSASDVAALELSGHPVVMLGACRGALGSRFREQPWSLPQSLLHAGARAVYAARSELPDAEVGDFFAALEHRLSQGEAPATALREERVRWLRDGKAWVREVVLFD